MNEINREGNQVRTYRGTRFLCMGESVYQQ